MSLRFEPCFQTFNITFLPIDQIWDEMFFLSINWIVKLKSEVELWRTDQIYKAHKLNKLIGKCKVYFSLDTVECF